tara:strand:+ start:914 stop:1348 length:435 start_codon:yes stop_codon:yes gene_type:complete
MKLFDWLKEVNLNKRDWDTFTESDQKTFQPYMINRFLSMDDSLVEIVNYFQKYSLSLLKPKIVYKFYAALIPKNKRFHRYIKSKTKSQYEGWLVDLFNKHFQQSSKQTEEYLGLMMNTQQGKEHLISILTRYGTEEKKIKTLKI